MAEVKTPAAEEKPSMETRPRRAPAAPGYKQPQEILRAYIDYRRARLQQIAGPPGINRGGSAAIVASAALHVLAEFEAFAVWLEEGQPPAQAVLTEDDKVFWLRARSQGMPVPPEIAAQL